MAVVVFEIVEVIYIGSPEGTARNLQIFYFSYGVILGILGFVYRAFSRQIISSK
jgi:hypothetical protein